MRNPAGLDRNNYDRAACETFFEEYKECKKREVVSTVRQPCIL